eukprot:TRINITY_DN2654_c0_g1_i3.p1 TRINITY_DN2654_c0_g1~~TRINITY_DN2654_c0_g1_i3.p1  ORF type:complete len:449 (-),score=135.02 TRINITY_DN2654_c0_g1_i3:410-1756(-)
MEFESKGANEGLMMNDFEYEEFSGIKDDTTAFDEDKAPGNTWYEAVFLIMASIVGVGVLGLPYNFSKVGWFFSILFLFTGAYAATYSGILIYRCCAKIHEREGRWVMDFPSMCAYVWGEERRGFFNGISYTSIAFALIIQQLVLTTSFQSVVANAGGSRKDFCLYEASGVVAFIMICFSQKRNLRELGWASIFGVTSIAVPLIIVFCHALSHETPKGDDKFINTDTNWGKFCSNLVGGVVFAFSGQILFPNFIANMQQKQDFPKCVATSSGAMTAIYLLVASLGYSLLGSDTKDPVTDDLGQGGASVVAELVLIFHVVVGYAISANVFNTFVYMKMFPGEDPLKDGPNVALKWLAITIGSIAAAFVIANVIPVFSDIVNLNGSTLGVFITYHLPAKMYIKLCEPSESEMKHLYFFMALGTGLCAVGTIGGLYSLAEDMGKNGVFPCVL